MRRRYLVAYDIRDERRLRQIAKLMEGFGDRAQYSVFLCDLSRADLADLTYALRRIVDTGEDYVLIVDLGTPESHREIQIIGRGRAQPVAGPRIV